jgi:hypothetical protein
MSSFSKAWSLVKMPNKAYACPRCELPTLLPHYLDWDKKGQEMYSTCINCGYVAVPNQKKMSSKYLTDEQKDEHKRRGNEINQKLIDDMNRVGTRSGRMPRQKSEFPNPKDIFRHPLEMVLADTGHESLSDLIRAYSRLKAEKDARLPDSMRSSVSDPEQYESELVEDTLSGFEERNAEHLLNTFLNMNRKVAE